MALITAPMILTVMIVGIVSNVIQTVTQIRDQALAFVPKVIAAGIVMTVCIPWYFAVLEKFVNVIFALVAEGAS